MPKQGKWKVSYVGLARGGWTAAAVAFAKRPPAGGANWKVTGVTLRDLDTVDAELTAWT